MKMKKAFKLVFISSWLTLLCLPGVGYAEDLTEITLSSEEWEGATQADGSGLYWDIIRLVYEPVGIKVNWSITSYARSVALVKQKRIDAWVGSYLDEESGVIYPKSHFDADEVSALFIRKSDQPWQGESSLEGKNVAWIKGYELHDYLDAKFNNRELLNRDAVIELLSDGRLDYFIDARPEIQTHFGEVIEKDPRFAVETIKRLNLYLGFANTLKGQRLADIFDERFPELIKSGELKPLFEKWAFIYIFE
jgi:polar amino acid transport system substrate-binding protein